MTPAEAALVELLEDAFSKNDEVELPVVRASNMLYITFHPSDAALSEVTFRLVVEEIA